MCERMNPRSIQSASGVCRSRRSPLWSQEQGDVGGSEGETVGLGECEDLEKEGRPFPHWLGNSTRGLRKEKILGKCSPSGPVSC